MHEIELKLILQIGYFSGPLEPQIFIVREDWKFSWEWIFGFKFREDIPKKELL